MLPGISLGLHPNISRGGTYHSGRGHLRPNAWNPELFKTPNTFVESVKDDGIYDAINRGISRATGDIIGLMHSDDFFAHNEVLSAVAKPAFVGAVLMACR